MTIQYGPCVINNGAVFWLPLPIESWEVREVTRSITVSVPLVGGESVLSVERAGFQISIKGKILGYGVSNDVYHIASGRTVQDAQDIKRVMEGYKVNTFIAESPFDGLFTLYRWKDRAYTNCRLESIGFTEGPKSSSIIPYSLEIVSADPYIDCSDEITDTSVWQELIGHAGGII